MQQFTIYADVAPNLKLTTNNIDRKLTSSCQFSDSSTELVHRRQEFAGSKFDNLTATVWQPTTTVVSRRGWCAALTLSWSDASCRSLNSRTQWRDLSQLSLNIATCQSVTSASCIVMPAVFMVDSNSLVCLTTEKNPCMAKKLASW